MSIWGRRGIICCRQSFQRLLSDILPFSVRPDGLLRLVAGSLSLLLIAVNHYSAIAYEDIYGRICFRPPEIAFALAGCSGHGTLVDLEQIIFLRHEQAERTEHGNFYNRRFVGLASRKLLKSRQILS